MPFACSCYKPRLKSLGYVTRPHIKLFKKLNSVLRDICAFVANRLNGKNQL